jgi:ABC-type multidrug transport system fused ATPase/permease subunit
MSLTPVLLHCVTEAAQALSAIERITRFLNRELREKQLPTSKHAISEMPEAIGESEGSVAGDVPLHVENASFLLGGSPAAPSSSSKEAGESRESGTAFKVSGITFSVQKGEVLAVCGPVGCGKKCKGSCSRCVAIITTTNTVNVSW